eukprot:CAMPEP_0119328228 /NCGR_PEP_ID=MMETSP1333-20130426/72812_1 /TAXON_ID=418940 /ORGANISM="Scyphosphaera apsteinii, Strain RCC1455" /LENGTH=240 /DNA_ID=CAMNT_0007337025 /DNA_START=173 /DNA_END=895 /DNA_ORIENTATION=+
MAQFCNMSQHVAVGTSSAAVAVTGTAGCASFGTSGAVDFIAAGAVAATAMLGARFGARLTSSFSSVQLARTFAIFQITVAPLVPIKAAIVNRTKAGSSIAHDEGDGGVGNARADSQDAVRYLTLAFVGLMAGAASGMFGIGGGVVVTPALCLFTDLPHTTVLGTTLASMIPPSLVSFVTHSNLGNVARKAVLPLCAGSAIGAFAGGQFAVRVPEELLQISFTIFIAGMGGSKLWALRGRM